MNFPRIIHQIWLQGEGDIPDKYKKNVNIIKNFNKDWQYILWDETKILNLINNYRDYIKTYYQFIYLHQKVDFARYIILYLIGGIYIDMDATSIKPLDSLVEKYNNYDVIISSTDTNILENYITCGKSVCYNNGVIISKQKAEIINNFIKRICKNDNTCDYRFSKIGCISSTTGPQIFTDFMIKHKNDPKLLILPSEYLEPCVFDNCNITENTFIKHVHEGSWVNINLLFVLRFYSKNKILCYLLVFILLSGLFVYIKML